MSPAKKGATKVKEKAAVPAKKAVKAPKAVPAKKAVDPGMEGIYRLWVLPPRRGKCPKTLNVLCPAIEKWTMQWWIWARSVSDALNNGSCCDKADVMWPPLPPQHCPSRPAAVSAMFRRWAAEMMVWAWDVDVNLQGCFRAWKIRLKKPRPGLIPDPPRKRRPVTVEETCKEINAHAKKFEKWGADVKKMLDLQGCDTGDPDGVSDPPPPPFD